MVGKESKAVLEISILQLPLAVLVEDRAGMLVLLDSPADK